MLLRIFDDGDVFDVAAQQGQAMITIWPPQGSQLHLLRDKQINRVQRKRGLTPI